MSYNDISAGFRNLIMALRSETHNTNSIAFMHGGKSFVSMMEDESIKGFGDWMFNNGFNTALTTAECYIRKLMDNLNVDQD